MMSRYSNREWSAKIAIGEFLKRGFCTYLLDARQMLARVVALLAGALLPVVCIAATPPGTTISNTAAVDYRDVTGNPRTVSSNAVNLVSKITRTPAAVDFVRVAAASPDFTAAPGTTMCSTGTGMVSLPPARLSDGTFLDPSVDQPLRRTEFFHGGEAFFIYLTDPDQNLDADVSETVTVNVEVGDAGDLEVVQLTEVSSNSGEFVGYVPSAATAVTPQDCMLQVSPGSRVSVMYMDPADSSDMTTDQALVDPFGLVFDSQTGEPVDNAVLRLVDVASGLPALVLGDDGSSEFPAELVSGGVATDSSGTEYEFGPGQYRFPLVSPGQYRLDVVAPAGYSAPSTAAIIDLQALPGGPFNLGSGSFGTPFTIDPGPALRVDIPLDPGRSVLFLRKTTTTAVASVGDFVRYALTLENTDTTAPLNNTRIVDDLPVGMRLVPGSVRVDGSAVGDPDISGDRRRLTFSLGDLAAASVIQVDYVTEIAAGSVGPEAVNTAQAFADGGAESNQARVSVRLAEALFRSQSTIVGRAIAGSCDRDSGNDLDGLAGVRIFLEDGRYVVTDDEGRYHFEGVPPGTHVVQLDIDTVPEGYEIVPCENNARFAGRAYSQFVTLRPGALWRADFHLKPVAQQQGEVSVQLRSAMAGPDVLYTLSVSGNGTSVSQLRPMVMMPEGVIFAPGSVRIDGRRHSDPSISGQLLTFSLPDHSGEAWAHNIEFRGLTSGDSGEHITKALVTFDTRSAQRQRTPLADNLLLRQPPATERRDFVFTTHFDTRKAQLKARDRAQIAAGLQELEGAEQIHVVISGHTDSIPIAPQNRHEFADNQALSEARAHAAAAFVRELLDLTPVQLTITGEGDTRPVASNSSAAGRAKNRRVEVQVWGEVATGPGDTRLGKADSGLQRLELQPDGKIRSGDPTPQFVDPMAEYGNSEWIDRLQPGTRLLLPPENYNPPIPSLRVVVQHAPEHSVELSLNDTAAGALSFDGKQVNSAKTIALSRFRGIDLQENDNLLEITVRDRDGKVVEKMRRSVHLSGGPVRAELVPELSLLVADGRTRPVVAVRLYDRWGKPARPDSVGRFRIDPPYRAWWEVESGRDNQMLSLGAREPIYRVGPDGVARIELEPTSRSGEVVLNMEYPERSEEQLRAWLEPKARDWILVGFAEGTAGYSTLTDNMQSARDAGFEEDFYTDGKVAFYAKGRIKGSFLLTLAYDSDRDEQQARRQLHGTVDPDRFYTLYGDATEQQFDAASQDEIYLRIEKGQFFAMFGDFDTGMDVTELSRYQRSFNGLHSEYQGAHFAYTAFAARSDQNFVKDEIRGDGTSGLYQLRAQPIVINSEKVTLETRDRFHSEQILAARILTRHIDYDIDYLNGTLFFKEPVRHRDDGLNPVYIVVDYESRASAGRQTHAGGRAAMKLVGGRVELGASMISEGMNGPDGELAGADLTWQLSDATELRAEFASSESRIDDIDTEGDAALAELRHTSGKVDGKVYYRQLDAGFGLGQQRAAETGTRKMGFDGRLRLSEKLSLNGEVYRHDNLVTDARREVGQAELRWQGARTTAGVGVRNATDELVDGSKSESSQVFVNGSVRALDNRVTLRAGIDTDLSDKANIAYPNRTTLGLDYRLSDHATLYAEHERADGDQLDAQLTRMGVRARPWNRAQLNSSVTQQMTEYGPRVRSNLGLVQGWQLNERLALDFGVDHSNTIAGPDVEPFNEEVGLVSGDLGGDFVSLYLGALYRHEDWTVNTRTEWRNSDNERRLGLFGGFYREQRQGRAFSAALDYFDTARRSGSDLVNADVRLSWAFRPAEARWIFLNRLDFRYEDLVAADTSQQSWRAVNNFHANWLMNLHNQLGFQYGVKYVRASIDGRSYNGFTDLVGLDWRRDLGSRWDVGVQGSLLHSWNSDVVDYSAGADIGYSLARNMWLSLGYNFAGFDDEDFSAARYTAHGPYIRFRIKADQDSFADRDFFSREPD